MLAFSHCGTALAYLLNDTHHTLGIYRYYTPSHPPIHHRYTTLTILITSSLYLPLFPLPLSFTPISTFPSQTTPLSPSPLTLRSLPPSQHIGWRLVGRLRARAPHGHGSLRHDPARPLLPPLPKTLLQLAQVSDRDIPNKHTLLPYYLTPRHQHPNKSPS